MTMTSTVEHLPPLCGSEEAVARAMANDRPLYGTPGGGMEGVRSAFAVALHMHQPLIPAELPRKGGAVSDGRVISNLQFMLEHPEVQDAHNAPAFLWCYKRMGELIPQLLAEGKQPRVMLDYSGCLLQGLRQMGAHDVIESLRGLTEDPARRQCVEWLGTAWGHAVAPSTPPRDFLLHVRAWQHDFAATFGLDALSRVRGFSPPEMALPNHPDVAYEFVRTLKACGYRWVLVQEHTVESADDGGPLRNPHVPHRLIARNSGGDRAEILAIVKTQGSDTKLVGQMQPYAQARGLPPAELGGRGVPQLVTQVGDGENGGVMMNEFPAAFLQAMREASGSPARAMNVTEYLEHLWAAGVRESDLPPAQPLFHRRIWDHAGAGGGPEKLEQALAHLRRDDPAFHVEGGSWTGDISWVRGYERLLGPMQLASAVFAERVSNGELAETSPEYREALFYLLLSQTSCFRYWGEGRWPDYGRELCRRAVESMAGDRKAGSRPLQVSGSDAGPSTRHP
jgi:hypothetical protein